MLIRSNWTEDAHESYLVEFWYTDPEGWLRQGDQLFFCNEKAMHEDIEKYALKYLSKLFSNPKIISVIYQ